jgi:hypothetical protein
MFLVQQLISSSKRSVTKLYQENRAPRGGAAAPLLTRGMQFPLLIPLPTHPDTMQLAQNHWRGSVARRKISSHWTAAILCHGHANLLRSVQNLYWGTSDIGAKVCNLQVSDVDHSNLPARAFHTLPVFIRRWEIRTFLPQGCAGNRGPRGQTVP